MCFSSSISADISLQHDTVGRSGAETKARVILDDRQMAVPGDTPCVRGTGGADRTGTIWDSYSAALAVTEALVTRVAEDNWDDTRARIEILGRGAPQLTERPPMTDLIFAATCDLAGKVRGKAFENRLARRGLDAHQCR